MTTNATFFRTVTADLPDYPEGEVKFYLETALAIAGAEVFPGKSYRMTLDANGEGSINLPVPDDTGEAAWSYKITLPSGKTYENTLVYDAGALALATWLQTAATTETPNDWLAVFLPKAGGAMTGPLLFTGTGHAGIALVNLTTAQRDAIDSPATGAIIWNTTTGRVEQYDGSGWTHIDASVSISGDAGNIVVIGADGTPEDGGTGIKTLNDGSGAGDIIFTDIANVVTAALDDSGVTAGTYGGTTQAASLTVNDQGLITAATNGAAVLPVTAGTVSVSSSRDLDSTDAGKILLCSGTITINCPNGLDAGFQCVLVNFSGSITVTASGTLLSADSATTIPTQYTAATLLHGGGNIWLLMGAIE